MAEDPEAIIARKLAEPKQGMVDGQSFAQHSIPDLISGAQFLSNKGVGKKKRKGIIFSQQVPGGAE